MSKVDSIIELLISDLFLLEMLHLWKMAQQQHSIFKNNCQISIKTLLINNRWCIKIDHALWKLLQGFVGDKLKIVHILYSEHVPITLVKQI